MVLFPSATGVLFADLFLDPFLDLGPWLFLFLFPLYALLAWVFPVLLWPLFWLVTHALYRFSVYHRVHIPTSGPALIVCNHVTYFDWLLLWIASPRPLRFVIWTGFYRNPLLRFILSYGRQYTIRIDNSRGRARTMIDALNQVVASLDAGEVVVVFAEQTLTRTGQMLPFGRGIERVLKQAKQPVPVIPTFLDNLWGTLFSWKTGRIFWKAPEGPFRRHVAVYFGKPLPPTSTAAEIRAAVQEANADCGIAQSRFILPAPRLFVRQACRFRSLFKLATVDVATGSERKLTWGRLLVAAWGLSDWLKPKLGQPANVAIWLPTGLGSTLANIALSFCGKTAVNLNYTTGDGAFQSAMKQAGIVTVISSKRFLQKLPMPLLDGVTTIHLEDAVAGLSGAGKLLRFVAVVVLPGWFLDRFVLGLHNLKLDDIGTILFSSGSTGEPKGVMLSYRNISMNIDGFRRGIPFDRTDRLLATLPFFHSFGYTICLWMPLVVGMETVCYPDPRQAKEVGELCKKHACTILLGTATFMRFYIRRTEKDDFRTLTLIVCGAEKLPVKLAEEFRDKFGVLPLEGYGCTELTPVVSVNIPDVTFGGVTQKANMMGTVGQPIPNVCAKTFDPETLSPLPHGGEGMIGVKGPNVMLGYLNQPEKTDQVVHNGWYMTGDIGLIEDEGFIRITGRVSRFAKIAGEMVPLERLDEEMHDILGYNGDRILAVAAVPDEKRGERVVVLHLSCVSGHFEALFLQLRQRGLPNLWIPDHRDCFLIEAFPVLGSGKLDLRRVGELAKEVAGKPVG